jgi:hypothetical protein
MGCSNIGINLILHHSHSESLTEDIYLRKSGACFHNQRSTSTLACSSVTKGKSRLRCGKVFNIFINILSRSSFYLCTEVEQKIWIVNDILYNNILYNICLICYVMVSKVCVGKLQPGGWARFLLWWNVWWIEYLFRMIWLFSFITADSSCRIYKMETPSMTRKFVE